MATDNQKFATKVILVILILSLFYCLYMTFFTSSVQCACTCKTKEEYADVGSVKIQDEAEFDPILKVTNNFQRVDLNAPVDPETGTHKSLLFGKANRIFNDDSITLDVEANLYVLGGDTYDSGITPVLGLNSDDGKFTTFYATEEKEKYKLYMSESENSSEELIGDLKKDGDGIYKLKTNIPLSSRRLKVVKIYFESNGEKVLVITGAFR
jgi:hypothetical protein